MIWYGLEDGPGLRDRQVVLAEVQAVGVAGDGQVGVVVHDEDGVVPVAQVADAAGRGQDVALVAQLVTQLDDASAAAERRLGELDDVPASGYLGVHDNVQPADLAGRHDS